MQSSESRKGKFLKYLAVIAIAMTLNIFFSNCTKSGSANSLSSVSAGNNSSTSQTVGGDGYSGKVYENFLANACPDGSFVNAKIQTADFKTYTLVRDNCLNITPTVLNAALIVLPVNNPRVVIYSSRVFELSTASQKPALPVGMTCVGASAMPFSLNVYNPYSTTLPHSAEMFTSAQDSGAFTATWTTQMVTGTDARQEALTLTFTTINADGTFSATLQYSPAANDPSPYITAISGNATCYFPYGE